MINHTNHGGRRADGRGIAILAGHPTELVVIGRINRSGSRCLRSPVSRHLRADYDYWGKRISVEGWG